MVLLSSPWRLWLSMHPQARPPVSILQPATSNGMLAVWISQCVFTCPNVRVLAAWATADQVDACGVCREYSDGRHRLAVRDGHSPSGQYVSATSPNGPVAMKIGSLAVPRLRSGGGEHMLPKSCRLHLVIRTKSGSTASWKPGPPLCIHGFQRFEHGTECHESDRDNGGRRTSDGGHRVSLGSSSALDPPVSLADFHSENR